ncbi:HVO_A0114 family putative DNA-binding protein [Natronorubrum texcoconense]
MTNEMALKNSRKPPVRFVRALATTDLDDVHVIRRETAERVLTPERERLLKAVTTNEITSVRDLARQLDRNVSVVSRDLDILFEADIIVFEQEGRSKIPQLAHENILVEPLVFDGDVKARAE